MSKLLVVLVIVFVQCNTIFPQFRETLWGQSENQVKKVEKGELVRETNEQLVFYEKATLLGMNTYITFDFFNNVLFSAGYLFDKSEANYDDFLRIKELLINKYGVNTEGHAPMLIATWNLKETLISLMLMKEQQKIGIIYRSKKYKNLEEERDKSKL